MPQLAHAPSAARSTASAVIATPCVTGARPAHVLIADANARTRAVRAEQLTAAGVRVSMARTSFEAIVKASCQLPDLILLDGSLADLNAAETGELLTTCPATAHIPIVCLAPGRRLSRKVLATALRQSA